MNWIQRMKNLILLRSASVMIGLLANLAMSLTVSIFYSPLVFAADESGTAAIRFLPVQDAGRIKPFDTLARESLQLIYGSQTYTTAKGEKRSAVEIVFTWVLLPKYWDVQKILQINHKALKETLNLPENEKYFSPADLFGNSRLGLVMQELASFNATKQKLNPYFSAVQRLQNQLGMYQAIKSGSAVRVLPPTPDELKASTEPGAEPQRWLSVAELQGEYQEKFAAVIHAMVRSLPTDGPAAPPEEVKKPNEKEPSLKEAVAGFVSLARMRNESLYPPERDISLEVHNQEFHPFKLTWVLYLFAAILLAIAWQSGSSWSYRFGWVLAVLALIIHSYGFGLRIYLTGRPPVSNMYESVVWVSWGCLVFSMMFEAIYRRKFILTAGSIVGVICLIVADLAPTILDSSLQPLEPVLRSNMWLTVHVLTITLSYSAFFLGWCLGNFGLGFLLRGYSASDERIRAIAMSIYRTVQVGVVLLAAGIILGGIWADYSWGRFWGWDPKETWAFIALLGYLAILHGRLVGWVQNIGMMASAVVSFNLVIMAWYGVNFVLGAGLHTYGMGAGGVQYVGAFILLNLIFVGYAIYVHFARRPHSSA